MRRRALLTALAVALLGAGCGGANRPASPHPRARDNVTELKDIGQLRAAFNAHPDVPRLIVLASPT